jgi:hypothetical protein
MQLGRPRASLAVDSGEPEWSAYSGASAAKNTCLTLGGGTRQKVRAVTQELRAFDPYFG